MNGPRRLREEGGSALEQALLEAGSSYRSSDAVRARTLAALGVAGSAALTAGTAGGASSALFAKAGWAKFLVVSGLGTAVAAPAGYYVWQHRETAAAPATPVVAQATEPVPHAAPTPRPAVPEPEVANGDEAAAPPAAAPSKVAEPRVSSASSLAQELAALDRVRARLGSGDASDALSLLDDYARTYPRGRLVLEAEVLRIDALAKSGQKAAAGKHADAFLKRHPNSVLASRVRSYLTE